MEPNRRGNASLCPQPELGGTLDLVCGEQPWHRGAISPSAEQSPPQSSLSSTHGSAACDGSSLTAVSTACVSHGGLSQSPALLPGCHQPAAGFSAGQEATCSKGKSLAAQLFIQTCCREGLALSSPYPGEMLLQTCCAENIMTFSSRALVLICRSLHAATGRAQQLSPHE